jgi:signal transduction histidine kinase
MSHELRTPMNAIVAYAELLGRAGRGDAKQTLWVEKLGKSTSYLLTLINDVLDLSQIEAGELLIEVEDCPLAELIGDVVELLRGQAEEKLLELAVVWDGPVPEKLRTDPVRFKQILVNLVANAIKFTSQGSVKVYVTCEDEDERSLAIAVADRHRKDGQHGGESAESAVTADLRSSTRRGED